MKLAAYVALLAGLAVALALIASQGVTAIATALGALGAGVLLMPAVYLPHVAGAAASWSRLFPPDRRPAYAVALRAMWIGLSSETLLPAATIGSEIVKARLLMRAGVRGGDAAASVVVDKTVQTMVLVAWGFIGVGVLTSTQADSRIALTALIGAGLLAAGLVGFVLAQHAGLFGFLAGLAGKAVRASTWPSVITNAADLDAAIRGVYGRKINILRACLIRFFSRSMLFAELWLAAYLMGQAVSPLEAVMLGSLVSALRGAAFFVPSGWGVQEGGFVLLGGLIGLGPDVMLAISLALRARELMISVPGLAVWQILEGGAFRIWLARRNAGHSKGT